MAVWVEDWLVIGVELGRGLAPKSKGAIEVLARVALLCRGPEPGSEVPRVRSMSHRGDVLQFPVSLYVGRVDDGRPSAGECVQNLCRGSLVHRDV